MLMTLSKRERSDLALSHIIKIMKITLLEGIKMKDVCSIFPHKERVSMKSAIPTNIAIENLRYLSISQQTVFNYEQVIDCVQRIN
jgi:hypothetical protein